MSITTTQATAPTIPATAPIHDHDERLEALALVPAPATAPDTLPAPAEGICGERLASVPADTEHGGWICTQPQGHLPGLDHAAEDGTTW